MIIKDQHDRRGFQSLPSCSLCASSQTVFYSAPLHTVLRQNPTLNVIDPAPVPGRAHAASRGPGLVCGSDKQRLLLAHRFAERWRASRPVTFSRQIVFQPHGQHFAARRLAQAPPRRIPHHTPSARRCCPGKYTRVRGILQCRPAALKLQPGEQALRDLPARKKL